MVASVLVIEKLRQPGGPGSEIKRCAASVCYMHPMRLSGKHVAVTGASSGLGRAIAHAFAKEGAAVSGFARRFKSGATKPGPGEVSELPLDVTDEAAVKTRMAEMPGLDILVNCAGTGTFGSFEDMSVDDLRSMLDTHVVGAFLCAREALRKMHGAGHIVNVSSVAAFRTFSGCSGYTAAKEGLRGLTRVLTEEARTKNIRVTGLYPGAIDTPIWDDRPGFDRKDMLAPESVAALVVDICCRPELSIEELLVLPPKGTL